MADINDLMSMQASAAPAGGADPSSLLSMAAPLASKGEELLKSGQVSLKEAKAAQKKLGLDKETVQNAFQKLVGGDKMTSEPGDAFSGAVMGQMPKPVLNAQGMTTLGAKVGGKATGTKSEQTAVQTNDQKKTRNTYADAQQAGDAMDIFRNTPEATSQREGITKMEQMLAMNQAHQKPNDGWIKGLLAYGDSLNGTNQAASFEPKAQKEKEAMLKFANEIQQRKGDYAKSIEDAMTKTKNGTDSNSTIQRLTEQLAIASGMGANGRGSGGVENPDKTWARVQALLETARGNPAVSQAEKDRYAAQKVASLMAKYPDPNNMPAAQVNLLTGETAKIATGGAPTMHELQGIDPATLQKIWSAALGKVNNKITPANAGQFLNELSGYAQAVSKDAEGIIQDKYGRVIESNKEGLGGHYQQAVSNYMERFKPKEQAAMAAAAPKTGKKLEDMTDQELEALHSTVVKKPKQVAAQ